MLETHIIIEEASDNLMSLPAHVDDIVLGVDSIARVVKSLSRYMQRMRLAGDEFKMKEAFMLYETVFFIRGNHKIRHF